jgi:hydroxymethylpyrimidine/phosphomethylpyrimidine kinase
MVDELEAAVERLRTRRLGHLVPEVQMNVGYALKDARDQGDILAFPGRIARLGDSVQPVGPPRFGASRHVANLILAARRHDASIRSAINVRFSDENVAAFRGAGLRVAEFSRDEETAQIKAREGSSLSHGVDLVAHREGCIPDVVFDRGDVGKEPMIRVFGTSPGEVVDKVLAMTETADA